MNNNEMTDVTSRILKAGDYRGKGRLNQFTRQDILYEHLDVVSEKLNKSRKINIRVYNSNGGLEQTDAGNIATAKELIGFYSETHTMKLYAKPSQNALIIHLGSRVSDKDADRSNT